MKTRTELSAKHCFTIAFLIALSFAHKSAASEGQNDSKTAKAPDIETFLQIGSAALAGVSWAGDAVYFTSSMSGKTQLYKWMGEDWPWQMSLFNDGVSEFYLSHNGAWAVISAADGGSEEYNLYLMNMANAQIDTLTRYSKTQVSAVVWSLDDNEIFFRSNHETPDNFQVYRMNLASREVRQFFDLPRIDTPASLTKDGKNLFVYNIISNVIISIHLVNIATGVGAQISPPGEHSYTSAHLLPDGKTVYLLTDNSDNGNVRLAKMTLGDTTLTFVNDWVDKKWSLDGLGFSRDDNYMFVMVNEDGYSRMKIREVVSQKDIVAPPLDGMAGEPGFDTHGNIYFTFSGPTYAPDVWKYGLVSKKLDKLSRTSYVGVDRTTFREPQLVKFKSFDGLEIPAFMYLPANYKKGEKIPLIVDAHGGPEGQTRPSFVRSYQYFMQNGYGILGVNPRGSSGYGKEYIDLDNYTLRQNSLKDYKAAADWLISSGYAEKGHLAIMGGSYGGYVTLGMITEYPDLFSAAIDEVGIANFVSFLNNTAPYRRAAREQEYGPLTDSVFLASISPLHKAAKIRTPLLVIHGENDPRVPVGEARQILNAVASHGGVVDSLIFPDEGHGAAKRVNVVRKYRRMVDFLDRHIKYQLSESVDAVEKRR